jgi:hypothetical protein
MIKKSPLWFQVFLFNLQVYLILGFIVWGVVWVVLSLL